MKKWYVIFSDKEQACDFVSINTTKGFLFLKYNEVTIRIFIPSFNTEYYRAKSGTGTLATLCSKRGKENDLLIYIVFK